MERGAARGFDALREHLKLTGTSPGTPHVASREWPKEQDMGRPVAEQLAETLGVEGWSRFLANELRRQITVNAVAPGPATKLFPKG